MTRGVRTYDKETHTRSHVFHVLRTIHMPKICTLHGTQGTQKQSLIHITHVVNSHVARYT